MERVEVICSALRANFSEIIKQSYSRVYENNKNLSKFVVKTDIRSVLSHVKY